MALAASRADTPPLNPWGAINTFIATFFANDPLLYTLDISGQASAISFQPAVFGGVAIS
jgi:hypothetical protein